MQNLIKSQRLFLLVFSAALIATVGCGDDNSTGSKGEALTEANAHDVMHKIVSAAKEVLAKRGRHPPGLSQWFCDDLDRCC